MPTPQLGPVGVRHRGRAETDMARAKRLAVGNWQEVQGRGVRGGLVHLHLSPLTTDAQQQHVFACGVVAAAAAE